MSDNNNIDDLFKKGLGNFQEEPSENLWLKVEKGLWLKKMLKTGLNIFIGVAVITATALIVFMITKNDKQISQTAPTSPQQSTIAQNTKTIDAKNAINTDKTISTTKITDNSTVPVISNKSAVKNNSTPVQKTAAVVAPSNVKTKNNYTANTENSNLSVYKKEPQKEKISEKEDIKKSIQEEALTQALPASEKPKDNIINSSKENEQVVAENKVKDILTKKTETVQNPSKEVKNPALGDVVKTPSEKIEKPVNEVQKKENEIKNANNIAETPNAEKNSKRPDIGIVPKPALMLYDVLFYVMPSYTGKTLSGISQEENNFRKNNEKAQVFLNYGMEFRVRIKNFSVQTGFNQAQAGEKNNYNYQYFKNIDTSGSYYDMHIFTQIDPQDSNNTIITFDSSWVNVSDSAFADLKLNNMNQIKYIEIPLNIGYIFNIKNHQFGISGGVSYAILSQASFSILDKATNTITSYTKDDNFLKKSLWSYNLALSYSYAVSGNTSLFIQSGFKKNINSIYSNSTTQQKYHFIDTKIGVMFKL